MNVNPMASVMAPRADNKADNPAQQTDDMFLQLLTTQLKNQSPLDPMDPTAFVGQLVQFNTLDQLIQIREILQQQTATPPQQ